MPSLTLSMAAAGFIFQLNGNPWLESALRGVRPVSLGMLAAAAVTLGITTYWGENGSMWFSAIHWNQILIALVSLYLLLQKKLSIPKTILIAAVLGLLIG